MPIYKVFEDKCAKDGICESVCPVKIIKAPLGELPSMRPEDSMKCLKCGQCVAFCPHGANKLEGLDDPELFDPKLLPEAESLAALLKYRRSIRNYKKKPVPKEEIEKLLGICRFAPSASNARTVRWLVVYEKENIKKLGDAMALAMRSYASEGKEVPYASMMLALARNWAKGEDPYFRGAPHVILAVVPEKRLSNWGKIDGAIALSYLEIMGAAMGFGLCWGGYITSQSEHPEVRKALGLKDDEVLAGAQMIGYPLIRPKLIPFRSRPETEWL